MRSIYKIAYRLLEEVPDLGAGNRETGNILIQRNNLVGVPLKAVIESGRRTLGLRQPLGDCYWLTVRRS